MEYDAKYEFDHYEIRAIYNGKDAFTVYSFNDDEQKAVEYAVGEMSVWNGNGKPLTTEIFRVERVVFSTK